MKHPGSLALDNRPASTPHVSRKRKQHNTCHSRTPSRPCPLTFHHQRSYMGISTLRSVYLCRGGPDNPIAFRLKVSQPREAACRAETVPVQIENANSSIPDPSTPKASIQATSSDVSEDSQSAFSPLSPAISTKPLVHSNPTHARSASSSAHCHHTPSPHPAYSCHSSSACDSSSCSSSACDYSASVNSTRNTT